MKCPNCDKEIPSGKKFCGFCGTKIIEPVIEQPPNPEPIVTQAKKAQTLPKWLFWAIPIGLIVIGLIVSVLLNWIPRQLIWSMFHKEESVIDNSPSLSNPADTNNIGSDDVSEDNVRMEIVGEWVGTIGNEEWSASLEVIIDEYYQIGSICGTYQVVNSPSRGELELISTSGSEYTFLEHPLAADELLPGGRYQTMGLIDDNHLQWSFEQELPSGDLTQSEGVLER